MVAYMRKNTVHFAFALCVHTARTTGNQCLGTIYYGIRNIWLRSTPLGHLRLTQYSLSAQLVATLSQQLLSQYSWWQWWHVEK